MVMRVDHLGWGADELDESRPLGGEFNFHFFLEDSSERQAPKERSEGVEATVPPHQGWNPRGRSRGSIQRKAWVPAEFDRPAPIVPKVDALRGEG